mgnify:CR=1 FL=1
MGATLSLCMITKNEEQFLADCLNSVKNIVDEIILVDTGSSDKTVEIAKSFEAKIHFFEWCDDFAAARNESLKYATKEWILILDADEIISKSDGLKIKELINNKNEIAYYITQRNYRNTKHIISSVETVGEPESKGFHFYNDNKIIRIFKNKKSIFFEGVVHELVEKMVLKIKKIIPYSEVFIHHYPEANVERSKTKRLFYLKITEKKVNKNPEDLLALYQLGKEYLQNRFYMKAILCFKNVLIKKKFSVEDQYLKSNSYYFLGICYESLNKLFKAKKMFKESLYTNKINLPALSKLLQISINENNNKESSNILVEISQIQKNIGKKENAVKSLEKSLEYNFSNNKAKNLIKKLTENKIERN